MIVSSALLTLPRIMCIQRKRGKSCWLAEMLYAILCNFLCWRCYILKMYSPFPFPLPPNHRLNSTLICAALSLISSCATCLITMLYFYCLASQNHGFGSINLRSMQAENAGNVVPPTSRTSNYVTFRFCNLPSETMVRQFVKYLFFSLSSTGIFFFL